MPNENETVQIEPQPYTTNLALYFDPVRAVSADCEVDRDTIEELASTPWYVAYIVSGESSVGRIPVVLVALVGQNFPSATAAEQQEALTLASLAGARILKSELRIPEPPVAQEPEPRS